MGLGVAFAPATGRIKTGGTSHEDVYYFLQDIL